MVQLLYCFMVIFSMFKFYYLHNAGGRVNNLTSENR